MMFWIRGRRLWNARKPKQTPVRDNWCNGVDIVIHHTADHGPRTHSLRDKARYLQGIQTFHQQARGWNDIGYNYAIFQDGTCYELRGFGVRGAHVEGQNTDSCGVTFPGTYTDKALSPAAVAAYRQLLKRLERHGAHIRSVKGHGDLMSTTCPGDGARKSLGLRKKR